jgi:hypothetical protein
VIRRLVAVLLLGTFGLSLALLTRRVMYAELAVQEHTETLPVSPGSAYYLLRVDGTLVGFATISVDTSVTAVRVNDLVDVRLPEADSVRHYQLRGETLLDRALRLRSFRYTRRVNRQQSQVAGRRVQDTLLVWEVGDSAQRAGGADTTHLSSSAVTTAGTLPLGLVYSSRVRVGSRRSMSVADPFSRRVASDELVVAGDSTFVVADSARQDGAGAWVAARWDSVHAWRLERRSAGVPSRLWVDDAGLPVAGELWPGLALERQPYEIVIAAVRAAAAEGFPALVRGPGSRQLTAAARPLRRQSIRLAGLEADTAAWGRSGLSGGPQHLRGNTVGVDLGADSARIVAEPPLGDGLVPGAAFGVLARRLTAGETEPGRIVARLARWTAHSLEPIDETDFPDARRALLRRRSGAASRVAVFTALARASGIPARPVAGLVADRGTWRRHSWAEVWLDGRWSPVDPFLGVVPASAAYLRLVEDAPADPMTLLPLAARLAPAAPTHQLLP